MSGVLYRGAAKERFPVWEAVYICYDLKITMPKGNPVRGYMTMPRHAAGSSLPIVLLLMHTKAELVIECGLIDTTCPAECVYAAFNKAVNPGSKTILTYIHLSATDLKPHNT